jgi:hypothetical protein
VSESPIDHLLDAMDRLDVDGVVALLAPGVRLLTVDGRRAHGVEAVRELVGDFLGSLRSTTHKITGQWHVDNVWIAEVDASYELQDRLQLNALPRAFVVRTGQEGIAEVNGYGAHERPLTDHRTGEEPIEVGGRWIPPL